MVNGQFLSPGSGRLSAADLGRRLARKGPPGRRRSPQSAAETLWPRGDHDLNPDFYDPARDLTPAAVLVPIVAHETETTVLFTKRTAHLHDHAGQVSFPGGRIDPVDRHAQDAALRETEEEVGLPRHHVTLVGELDTYVTRTGFEVVPVVGLLLPPFPVEPDSFEVDEVFEVPLSFLLDPANRRTDSRVYQGKERQFYAYTYESYYIWGATAGMLVNLAEVLGE